MGFTSGTWESWNGDFRILHQICEVSHRISADFPQDFTENFLKNMFSTFLLKFLSGFFCEDFLVHPAPAVKSLFQNMFFHSLESAGQNLTPKNLLEC